MKQKGSAGIIILVIALILAGLAGAYFFGKSQTINPQSPIPQGCTEEAMVCPDGSAVGRTGPNCEFAPCPSTNKIDETTNWKTYVMDNPNGFSLKYPPSWSVEKGNGTLTINSNEKFPQVENDPEPIMYWININVYTNPLKKTFKDFVTVDLSDGLKQKFTYKTETINGYITYRTTMLPSQAGCDFVYIERQDNSFAAFNFCLYDENKPFINQEKFHNIFNQILSTFKFLP